MIWTALFNFVGTPLAKILGILLVIAGIAGGGFWLKSVIAENAAISAQAAQAAANVRALQLATGVLAQQTAALDKAKTDIATENATLKDKIANAPHTRDCADSPAAAVFLNGVRGDSAHGNRSHSSK